MGQLVVFAMDKLGGIGATIGACIGYWYWNANATWNCTGYGENMTCPSGAAHALEFADGLWGLPEFTGLTTVVGAGLWLGGAAAYKALATRQEA